MSDWDWFFPNDAGRSQLLRAQVAELASAQASARPRGGRISSQLSGLEGPVEKRLEALTVAFDAYVELGDVREQLATHVETALVRREVLAAIDALVRGRRAERVTPVEGDDYWLPHAMNAVTALIAGGRDRAAEGRARTLGRQADLFRVVLLGALGHGVLVRDGVPDLLATDGPLDDAQVALWHALLAGVYGETGEGALLDAVEERWRPALAGGEPDAWRSWVVEQSEAEDPDAELAWVRGLLAGEARPASGSGSALEHTAEDPRASLRAVAGTLIAEGSEQERELLVRARQLRRRVEDPSGTAAGPFEPLPAAVADLVRQGLLTTSDPALRARLLAWSRPGLLAAVELAAASPVPPVRPVERQTSGGALLVGPEGADPEALARARQTIVARSASPERDRSRVTGGAAGGLAVLAVVAALLSSPLALVALLGVAAFALGLVAVLTHRKRRRTVLEQADHQAAELAAVDRAVDDARRGLAEAEAARKRRAAARAALAEGLRRDLRAR